MMMRFALVGLVSVLGKDNKANPDAKKTEVPEVSVKMGSYSKATKEQLSKAGKLEGTLTVKEATDGKSVTITGTLTGAKCENPYPWHIHEGESCKDIKEHYYKKDGEKKIRGGKKDTTKDPWTNNETEKPKDGKLTINLDTAKADDFKTYGKTWSVSSDKADLQVNNRVIVVYAPKGCIDDKTPTKPIACGEIGSAYLPAVGLIATVLMMFNI